MLSPEIIQTAPKILLHDHLDGGLRPSTIVQLAKDSKIKGLPTYNATELGDWMTATADRKEDEQFPDGFWDDNAAMRMLKVLRSKPSVQALFWNQMVDGTGQRAGGILNSTGSPKQLLSQLRTLAAKKPGADSV